MKYQKPFYEVERFEVEDIVLTSTVVVKYLDTPDGPKAEMNVDYNSLFGLK